MSERISRDDVAAVAKLARLRLSDAELDRATSQLGDILDHAADMASLDLEGVALFELSGGFDRLAADARVAFGTGLSGGTPRLEDAHMVKPDVSSHGVG